MTQPDPTVFADGAAGGTPLSAANVNAIVSTANAALLDQLIPTTTKTYAGTGGAYTASYRELVLVDASGGSITVTAPAAAAGQFFAVLRVDDHATNTNTVTVQRAGTDVLTPGGTTRVLRQQGECPIFVGAASLWVCEESPSTTAAVQWWDTPGTYTWTKPAGARVVSITAIGGGGAGGGGPRTASGTAVSGGAGGAGGGHGTVELPASVCSATETVQVGGGGSAGAAATTNSTNGGVGGDGGASIVASGGSYKILSYGGAGGGGGFAGTSAGGGATVSLNEPNNPGANGTAGTAGATGNSNTGLTPGGASGGGLAATANPLAGGSGSTCYQSQPASPAGGLASGAAAGGNGTSVTSGLPLGGSSGAGGASRTAAAAGNGGNGGNYGAGGGGGGAALNGQTAGAGGTGGSGLVLIVTYF